jgi:hypothetical protein
MTYLARRYGMRVQEVEEYTMEFTEAWIERQKHEVLFDNFTSRMALCI